MQINVYIGSAEAQLVPSKVLEYSIKKHTTLPVNATPLYQLDVNHRMPKDVKNHPRTPFSFQRFFVPQLCNEKAFYLDSDMLVFQDMAPLLDLDFEGKQVISVREVDSCGHSFGAKPSYAVLLLDCPNISWDIDTIIDKLDTGNLTYERLMFDFEIAEVALKLGPEWNHLDTYKEGETALLHYTNMSSQPWRSHGHPFGHLWKNTLKEAVKEGFIEETLVRDHIKRGFIQNPF